MPHTPDEFVATIHTPPSELDDQSRWCVRSMGQFHDVSRSLIDGINVLADWCGRGLRVVSVTQQIDFSGAVDKMLAAVLLGVAELEQETRRERQRAGIEVAKEKGVYRGRKPGATKRGVDPSRAVELRQRGLTYSEISQALGVSVSSVRRYVSAA